MILKLEGGRNAKQFTVGMAMYDKFIKMQKTKLQQVNLLHMITLLVEKANVCEDMVLVLLLYPVLSSYRTGTLLPYSS